MKSFNDNLALIASDPIHRISFGGDMASASSFAVRPPVGGDVSVEHMANLASGWKQPGLKSQFDWAWLSKDANKMKQLLPHVPEDYLAATPGNGGGVGSQVYDILLKAVKGKMPPAVDAVNYWAKAVR